jgi:hypothetical protein
MFASKKSHSYNFLAVLLLIYFSISTMFLLVHSVSHQFSNQSVYKENSANTDQKSSHTKCDLCDLFVTQNQLLSFKFVAFAVLSFYLAPLFFIHNRVKLSYLLSSHSVRAPPLFS